MMSNLDAMRAVATMFFVLWGSAGVCDEEVVEIKRVSTTILTEDVDACVAFWTERLGFEQSIAVPAQQLGETGNQFAAVSNDRHEVMFQSFKSTEAELPGMFAPAELRSFMLYVEVSDLDAIIESMQGLKPAVSRRTTFYGSEEIGYFDTCGTLVILAEFPTEPDGDPADGDVP